MSDLHERLAFLVSQLYEKAYDDPNLPDDYLRDTAATLADFCAELERDYVRTVGVEDEEIPTNAQGIALARFLRPHFRRTETAAAYVFRGAAGLGPDYLYVRFPDDGYEGGIATDGSIST